MFITRGSLGISDINLILFTFDNNIGLLLGHNHDNHVDNHAEHTACILLLSVREIIYVN